MTPEEAAEWAEQVEAKNPRPVNRVEITGETCMLCGATIYLNSMCGPHWRLLIGYPGYARLREDEAVRLETLKNDPIVVKLERLFADS